jgi:hypothetical protein
MPERDEPPPPKRPQRPKPKPIDGSAYGASSSESGGNYDWAGPTSANVEGEPADEEVDEALEEAGGDTRPCEFCGKPIDVGQAWMRADEEGAELRAHAECLYRQEPKAAEHREWQPGS